MAGKSRLGSVFRSLQLIWLSVKLHYHTFKEALRKDGLTSLRHPQRIRDAAAAKLFLITSNGFFTLENTTCVSSLVRSAQGKILGLGSGPGNQVQRYDPSLVKFIYAIDLNPHYGDTIAAKVKKLGLQDKYKFLACDVRSGGCEECNEGGVEAVKVWGSFIFWEHVKNKDTFTAMAQACLNPAWSAFAGCCLNRHIKADILAAGEWENPDDIEVADDPYTCLPRIWGVLKRKA